MSYLEIYNEEVNDLLQPPPGGVGGRAPFAASRVAGGRGRGRNLKLLAEDGLRGAVVEGLREVPVDSWEEARFVFCHSFPRATCVCVCVLAAYFPC